MATAAMTSVRSLPMATGFPPVSVTSSPKSMAQRMSCGAMMTKAEVPIRQNQARATRRR
jgi:hypothetical protein